MHKKPFGLLVALLAILALAYAPLAEAGLRRFEYSEDFEREDPVSFWVSNGEHAVNYKGTTDEKAFSGKRSFKLDVTLKGGSYHYWSVPVRVPCAGRLKFSARIFVERPTNGRVGVGANFVFPPTHHSGCGPIETFDRPTGGWKLQQWDLVQAGAESARDVIPRYVWRATGDNVVVYLDRWGLFISGGIGKRVVVYVDDVKIEGEVPTGAEQDAEAQRRWQPVRDAFARQLNAWHKEVRSAIGAIGSLAGLPAIAERLRASALRTADAAESALAAFGKTGYAAPWEVSDLQNRLRLLRSAAPNLKDMTRLDVAQRPFLTYPCKAITNAKILPDTFPIAGRIGTELRLSACTGEYEPTSFALCALDDVRGMKVSATELKSGPHTIPATAVDIRVVKCWFQAGTRIWGTKNLVLTPELLLKDDGLVRVDREKKENRLRTPDASGHNSYVLISGKHTVIGDIQPRDAETLQPVDIPPFTTRQFWVTVHVPDDAAAGNYEGTISLQPANTRPCEMKLRLRVLPFALEEPALRYSIYYRGRIRKGGEGSISSEWKSPRQYEAEMRDMLAHGVAYPTVYQGYDEKLLARLFDMRQKAGLPREALYTLGICTGNPSGGAELRALQQGVRKWIRMAKHYGYDEVYIYGLDEAKGERLKSQRPAWKAVRDVGGKVFVACSRGTFEAMGDLLDLAVYAGPPLAEEAKRFHSVGHRIFCYANPQVGIEEPETYRRNFGLLLWKAGYDGAMDYAYQHAFGHIWNDFDHPTYRDHNFTYPTVDGVIDTIQWEGFREGVDDVRYLTTLLGAIRKAKATRPELASEAERWVENISPLGNLDALRAKMIEWISKLQ